MLQESDLSAFLQAMQDATSAAPEEPIKVLAQDDGLFPQEVRRLVASLEIASVMGDASAEAASVARIILQNINMSRCKALADQTSWSQAIAWARAHPVERDVHIGRDRERLVGEACRRLRQQRYKIDVGAYGPAIAPSSRREIATRAESLIDLLGGFETAQQILRFMRDAKFYHDGIWLFGQVGLNIYDKKKAMIPVGWLLSLALKKLDLPARAAKPAVAWRSLVELATDFAAAHDCQRYNQFDGIELHPSELHRELTTSILWREIFTLPQTPPRAFQQILDALLSELTPDDEKLIGFSLEDFSRETSQLFAACSPDEFRVHHRERLQQRFPLLWRLTGGAPQKVNADYRDPLDIEHRTQEKALFMRYGADRVVTLPTSFLATAAFELAFYQVWSKLGKRASDVVGAALERAIANACHGKTSQLLCQKKYQVAKDWFEIDVATRDGDRIVFIETKGKVLTRQSRSGNVLLVFQDYTDSFLRMLSQLIRHETSLRAGLTPLTVEGEQVSDLRPLKVAVSPLSYGQVTDKLLSNNIVRSLAGTKFVPVANDKAHQSIIDSFNDWKDKVLLNMMPLAPERQKAPNLFAYLLDVFWLDMGQLLYILDRADTVWNAFQPLKHMSFSSRDFWTELAYADQAGLTAAAWRPIRPRD